ncbi:glucose-induced degradation protein 8 homolog [Hetaerina americana]|uniref:glucose-induced degradation protein 8 homolog n=1 Tax=Hetaerina americana TaxID=62018 RepID=UPI003A7F1FA3
MSYTEKHESITKDDWMSRLEGLHIQRADMNKLIMNYLVTEGFKEAAEKFQQESGAKPSVDLDSLDDRIRIRDAVQGGRVQEATALVNHLHPELLDNDRYLYFHLQQLHLIELIRAGRVEEALRFAQEQLSEAGESDPTVLAELERTLALLAFEEPDKSPFADLLHPTHRQKVASELNAAILRAENCDWGDGSSTPPPRLTGLLKLILWAQEELDRKKIKYPRMSILASAVIDPPTSK